MVLVVNLDCSNNSHLLEALDLSLFQALKDLYRDGNKALGMSSNFSRMLLHIFYFA